MPLGVVNDDDFNRELNNSSIDKSIAKSEKIITTAEIIEMNRAGRKENDVEVPDALRKIIGEESVINGRASALDLAKHFDVSPSSVSAYANGSTSTASYNNPIERLSSHLTAAKLRVATRARKKLNKALEHITEDKLGQSSARELSGVAKDMAQVMKSMEPDSPVDTNKVNTPQFIVFAPTFRDERSFESITVKE